MAMIATAATDMSMRLDGSMTHHPRQEPATTTSHHTSIHLEREQEGGRSPGSQGRAEQDKDGWTSDHWTMTLPGVVDLHRALGGGFRTAVAELPFESGDDIHVHLFEKQPSGPGGERNRSRVIWAWGDYHLRCR